MRFNSTEHLEAWRTRGIYPRIHDAMAQVITTYSNAEVGLDLCCSFGLLGQRIASATGMLVVGVDADDRALQAGKAAGIGIELVSMRVSRETHAALDAMIERCKVQAVFARRALPELFGHDIAYGRTVAWMLRQRGVREVFIEGRVAAPGAVNPLHSLDKEVALMTGPFVEARRIGNVAHMKAA